MFGFAFALASVLPGGFADDSSLPPATPRPLGMVLAHGGAGTLPSQSPRTALAARAAWAALGRSEPALDAAVAAAVVLEDDPEFNAGTGSNIRMDGQTVQMDAAVMNERGDFGAVAVIERVKNPVLVAREVMRSPHLILAGEGATRFARSMGLPDYDPRTPESIARYHQLRARMDDGSLGAGWDHFDWKRHWNFPAALPEDMIPHDTIGAVVADGRGGFAVAVSTGGTTATLDGRVGDVPVPGAGAFAGPAGAVCATGWGEYIIRENLSRHVYDALAAGELPQAAIDRALALFPGDIGIGLIVVSPRGWGVGANTTMAWAGVVRGDDVSAQDPRAPR